MVASIMTTCHRLKHEKASEIDELVRKRCCRMPSPTHPAAHRSGHMICLIRSAECGYQEPVGRIDHCCYRLGSGFGRHALLTISLPSSPQRCRQEQLRHDLRYIELLAALSFLNAVLKIAQRPAVVVLFSRSGKRAWTPAAGMCTASRTVRRRDAFVTLLSHF